MTFFLKHMSTLTSPQSVTLPTHREELYLDIEPDPDSPVPFTTKQPLLVKFILDVGHGNQTLDVFLRNHFPIAFIQFSNVQPNDLKKVGIDAFTALCAFLKNFHPNELMASEVIVPPTSTIKPSNASYIAVHALADVTPEGVTPAVEYLRVLVAHGYDLREESPNFGMSLLIWAGSKGMVRTVNFILDTLAVQLNSPDFLACLPSVDAQYGSNFLMHLAFETKNPEIFCDLVRKLKGLGVDSDTIRGLLYQHNNLVPPLDAFDLVFDGKEDKSRLLRQEVEAILSERPRRAAAPPRPRPSFLSFKDDTEEIEEHDSPRSGKPLPPETPPTRVQPRRPSAASFSRSQDPVSAPQLTPPTSIGSTQRKRSADTPPSTPPLSRRPRLENPATAQPAPDPRPPLRPRGLTNDVVFPHQGGLTPHELLSTIPPGLPIVIQAYIMAPGSPFDPSTQMGAGPHCLSISQIRVAQPPQ